jgi:ArsR family transcriptional regulator
MAQTSKRTTAKKAGMTAVDKPTVKKAVVSPKNAVAKKSSAAKSKEQREVDKMLSLAAETFRVMSAPMRLKIINCLCQEEKNVGQLLDEIKTTQPNMSQHLNTLYKAKILGKRRDGVQIYYRIINDRVVTLCRAVCTQIAIDSDLPHPP